jgi:DNA invertase Pin-like site-specific DNA recombinase
MFPRHGAGISSSAKDREDFQERMLDAINVMLLDMLAAVARKDYEDRRRRQAQGIEKAKGIEGRYKGRPEDKDRNAAIVDMLRRGLSWGSIVKATGCSRSTLSKLAKRAREQSAATASQRVPARRSCGSRTIPERRTMHCQRGACEPALHGAPGKTPQGHSRGR